MLVVLCLAGFLVGFLAGKPLSLFLFPSTTQPMQFESWRERWVHGRNMGMRLSELALQQSRMDRETEEWMQLLKLREDTSLLLANMLERMTSSKEETANLEEVERCLELTSRSLRIFLEIGRSPIQSWENFRPKATHLAQCFNALFGTKNHKPNSVRIYTESNFKYAENEIDAVQSINLLFKSIHSDPQTRIHSILATHHGLLIQGDGPQFEAYIPWMD